MTLIAWALLIPAAVGYRPNPRDFAEAALQSRSDFRLEAYIAAGGKDPEETHFDDLDWVLGFSELWLYALRSARLALEPTIDASKLRPLRLAEQQLLGAAPRGEPRQRKALEAARVAFDEFLDELKQVNGTGETTSQDDEPSKSIGARQLVNGTIRLSNGLEMPRLGLGTTMLNGQKGQDAMVKALKMGYRLVDTAQAYENEAELGDAWHLSRVPRTQLFLATKLSDERSCKRKKAKALVRLQLKRLKTTYIDQYMLHSPCPGMLGAWKDLEELYDEGVLRSLGVSNFNLDDLSLFNAKVRVKPHVVQNKFSIYHRGWAPVEKVDVARRLQDQGVVLMGYCNLDAYPHVLQPLEDVHVKRIAQRHGRSAAQVLLRHALQHGTVVIPKSERTDRLREKNADIFTFELSDAEMRFLDALPLLAYHFQKPEIEDLFASDLGFHVEL